MIRRTVVFSALFLMGALAFAQPAPSRSPRFANRLLEDVVQMTRAGLADETIIAYVQARRSRLDSDTTAEDLIQLRRAGVSETVVGSIARLTGNPDVAGTVSRDVQSDSGEDVPYADQPEYDGDGYAYSYGYPYGYPYWYAYSPWFSGGIVLRGGGFHRGFGQRSFGHGHFGSGRGGHRGGGHGGGRGHR